MPAPVLEPPPGAATSTVAHRIPFYETDAMGIVHHANYVKYLELARVVFMDEHDRPYRDYVAMQLHFATTRVEIDYRRPLRFDDRLEVTTWIRRLRGASIHMDYRLTCQGQVVASASTQHAMVDADGRPARIPREHRERLGKALGAEAAGR
jgi:acyl-CoA thioester hydrolase